MRDQLGQHLLMNIAPLDMITTPPRDHGEQITDRSWIAGSGTVTIPSTTIQLHGQRPNGDQSGPSIYLS